jgi:hypothetical protein
MEESADRRGPAVREALRRVRRDLRSRRNVEAYVVAALALVFAVLSLIGDVLPDGPRWAALLGGVGLLVYRITLPEHTGTAENLLGDRARFETTPFSSRLDRTREVWIFAPSAVNLLNPQNCEALRSKVLQRRDGVVRIVVLDPDQETSVRLAARQLDDSVDYPVQTLAPSLAATVRQLQLMTAWKVLGSIEYRFLDYNPGFSLVAIDPGGRSGKVIVEFHAFHNEATTSRMHMELSRADSERWYAYWTDQFDHIWRTAHGPAS